RPILHLPQRTLLPKTPPSRKIFNKPQKRRLLTNYASPASPSTRLSNHNQLKNQKTERGRTKGSSSANTMPRGFQTRHELKLSTYTLERTIKRSQPRQLYKPSPN
ncbi:hypothetical protein KC19_VG336700, partial [Ceratodon purpureus]